MSDKQDISINPTIPDPLNVIPDIEWSRQNILYGICVILSILLVAYGLAIHFSTFSETYYPEVATVTYVDCNRFPVNNHRSEYHCVVGIEYPDTPDSTDMIDNSLTFIDSEPFFQGDLIEILVDRTNPLNIEVKVVSDQNLAIVYCICGLLLLTVVTGIRFMRIV